MMRSKLYMDLIIKTGDFVRKLRDFILEILDDYRSGGNLILNPENTLKFDSIQGTRALEGRTNVDAIELLGSFLEELYGFMNIGSLKQFHRDDQE
jgi:hypothetical protein